MALGRGGEKSSAALGRRRARHLRRGSRQSTAFAVSTDAHVADRSGGDASVAPLQDFVRHPQERCGRLSKWRRLPSRSGRGLASLFCYQIEIPRGHEPMIQSWVKIVGESNRKLDLEGKANGISPLIS